MKKAFKLTAFNISIILLLVLGFSKRLLGLSFDTSNPSKFALALGLTVLGAGFFIFGNYYIFTKKVEIKIIKNADDIDSWIKTLTDCIQTDPTFRPELEKAISQLKTLKRRDDSLTKLLAQSNLAESFGYLNNTGQNAKLCIIANTNKIAKRLIVFDDEAYRENKDQDITEHKDYVQECLTENDTVLDEYQKLLLAVSRIGDVPTTGQLEEVRRMTNSLNTVLGESEKALLNEKN